MKDKNNKIRIIKKYRNRRLYDVSTSSYVIIDDIKQIILDGDIIQVVDIQTNKDVTRNILLQIIFEEELNGVPMFSNSFLSQLIKFYGKTMQSSLGGFFEQGLDIFKQLQKNFYEQFKENYGKDKANPSIQLWRNFIESQNKEIEKSLKDQIKQNTHTFFKMQEQLHEQTKNFFNYLKFPFSTNKED
jgi:polyhydroxyalkanoate synthesis repressor PhaR